MSKFTDRMLRAAKLDVDLYEEVEADETSMKQAMGVVVLSSVAAGIGDFSLGLIPGIIGALMVWYLWSFITYLIGAKLLPEPQTKTDYKEMLRTIGFASSPGLIRVFGIVPMFKGLVFFVAEVWMLVAMIIAIRQALDYQSTGRAIGVVLVGWFFAAFAFALFLAAAGVGGA